MKIKDVAKVNEKTIGRGFDFSEIEYLDTSSVTEGFIEKTQILKLKDAPSRAKRVVRKNDILISTVRPNLKHFALITNPKPNTIASTGFAVITCYDVFPQYLYRFLATDEYTAYLSNIAENQQSNYPAFNPSLIEDTVINLPSIETQKKIAAVLSAYDDLIKNNKRRIELLEKIAEEIYREWFVRMRFPGYKETKFEKGLPKSWDIVRIKKIVDRKSFGRIYRESELSEEGKIVVIDQSRSDYLGFYDGEAQHIATVDSPIILFGDHSCKMVLMTKPFSLAENVIPFKPEKDISTYFLFHLIKDLAKTTEYKRHWGDLTTKEVLLPKKELQYDFEKIVIQNHKKIELLQNVIAKLTKTRDLLLSRLISGKLSVENLDIKFPPSMREEEEQIEAIL